MGGNKQVEKMRTIKFRALKDDMSDCSFVYGELVYDAIGQPRITHKDFSGKGLQFNTCIKETEGQFTGIKDIKGNDVFEGDLLGIGDSIFGFITNQVNETVYYEVKVDGCDYILYRNDIKLTWGRLSRLDEMGWNCTVLGNIHQNPELLNP